MLNKVFHNEQELLQSISQGNNTAFEQLYDIWWDRIYSTALLVSKSPEFSRDIVQEVFLTLWKQRERLTAIENLTSFLFITTRNMVYKKLRRMKLEDAYTNYMAHRLQGQHSHEDPEGELHLKELSLALQKGIEQLPPQQQRAFRLSREQWLTHEQIAREMGVSQATVKDYIVRALAFLRNYMKEQGGLLLFLLYCSP